VKAAAVGKPGEVIIVDFPELQATERDLIVETLVCGVCATDVKLVRKGASEVKYALGHEMVGRIIQRPNDSIWNIGDRVVIAPYLSCGHCYYCLHRQEVLCPHLYEIFPTPGGMSERILVSGELAKRGLFQVPDGMSDAVAALSEPLGCVLEGLDASHLKAGDSLLVIGDGPMGQLTAAAGKALGAGQVIMAGMTGHRLESAQKYFADVVVDITREDLGKIIGNHTDGRGADVVMVAVSSANALITGLDNVRPGGMVNSFAGVPEGTNIELDVRKLHYHQFYLTGSSGTTPEFMAKALSLMETSNVEFSKVVTARYPFSQAAKAVDYADQQTGLKSTVYFSTNVEAN
jgi:threonine dehydrogenase-like Zn-dependent dehydrogenase